ncbi:MAG: hypothetical protein AB7F31_05950 [Parachlamydiales bacterium]
MKRFGIVVATLGLLSACQRPCNNYVDRTYVHKYGLEVDQDEWNARGQGGQIITTRKDGVVVTRSYDNSLPHGPTTYTFPHSNLVARTETYERGKLISETDHYETGIAKQEIRHSLGGARIVSTWFEDGTPRSQETYQGDVLIAGDYFTTQNLLESRVREGAGKRIVRSNSGALQAEENILEGEKILETTFYASGEPKAITAFRGGKVDGTRKTFLPGGLPNTIETWKSGEQDGITTLFAMGEKKAEVPYIRGKREGVEIRFGADGHRIEEVSWKGDMKHGPDRFYVKGDEAIDWYHEGKRVRKEAYEKLNPPPLPRHG